MQRFQGTSIGQLARAAGVATSTVRFYERRGLLKPDQRSQSNYRLYSPASLERLRFIRACQATGLSLKDIRALLDLAYSTDEPCDDLLALARNRLDDVRRKIKDLRRVERALGRSLDLCCKGEQGDLCGQLGQLRGKPCTCRDCSSK